MQKTMLFKLKKTLPKLKMIFLQINYKKENSKKLKSDLPDTHRTNIHE